MINYSNQTRQVFSTKFLLWLFYGRVMSVTVQVLLYKLIHQLLNTEKKKGILKIPNLITKDLETIKHCLIKIQQFFHNPCNPDGLLWPIRFVILNQIAFIDLLRYYFLNLGHNETRNLIIRLTLDFLIKSFGPYSNIIID